MMEQPVVRPAVPPVVLWFKIYCGAKAAMYLFIVALGLFFLLGSSFLARTQDDRMTFLILGPTYILMGLAFMVPFVLAIFLPPRSWVWIYGIVLISIGMLSCCFLPATIPLIIFWVKPDVQRYFGRATE